jgi:hypothetical protein
VPLIGYKNFSCRACLNFALQKQVLQKMQITTLKDILAQSVKWSSRHAYQPVRNYAKKMMKYSGAKRECAVCKYSNHVEVCHKIGIANFPLTATLAEINVFTNLVFLCPNHHYELDNGLLKL